MLLQNYALFKFLIYNREKEKSEAFEVFYKKFTFLAK